jgi:hypothetical protein
MTDWIAWTRCRACGYSEKDVFQKPDDAPSFDATPHVRCPTCANPARYITFPAFDIQTIELSPPGDAMYETMDDW